jgi:FRG domain-containing protein
MKEVTSLIEYLDWVENPPKGTKYKIYRGQQEDWEILPNIQRQKYSDILGCEKKLLSNFKKSASGSLVDVPDNDFDWLGVAQHYGLPTRLVDWSENPKVALWFALENAKQGRDKPTVWRMLPEPKDFEENHKNKRPFAGSRTKVFRSNFKTPRIMAQKGLFTVFKCMDKQINSFSRFSRFVPLQKNKVLKERMDQVFITSECINDIREALKSDGYTKGFIYPPELKEVAEEVKKEINIKAGKYK